MNGFIKANLISMNHIDVMVFSNAQFDNALAFQLFIDGKRVYSPTIIRRTTNKDIYLFRLELKEPFDFSKRYHVSLYNFPMQIVDVSNAIDFKEFDNMFKYDGDDLGANYSKEETTFVVWAPLSPSVQLKIENNNHEFDVYQMIREEKGIHRITLKGDYKNRLYNYLVENNGVVRETTDVYGKGSAINSTYSAVIDFNEINRKLGVVEFENSKLKPVGSIIYEVHVRDFTEDKNTDIVNKGKYLGFVEEGCLTKKKHPAGLDYLTALGITHVQLQPIHDVDNVPEDNPKLRYNWGYDPCNYFALEGAYSTHPEIPNCRIEEFKTMVNKLHEKNIGVIIDVVYNHCYEWLYTCFEKTVPGYYFRKKRDGILSSCSGCGNDIASERPMVRKMIIDSVKYLFEEFDIDGLRFDLMGLLDIETMKQVEVAVRNIKPNAFLYGEGWNMGMQIPESERATTDNADLLPGYGFFNDMYRDIIKGPTFPDRITEKGFVNGDINYYFGLEYIMNGSVLDLSYRHRFDDANQSINYAECHDNNTLFDKLVKSNPEEDEDTIYQRVKLANSLIFLSFGVPFFHMGQEIGQSKLGLDNTYNLLKINNMQWDLVDKNYEMVTHFAQHAKLRRECKNIQIGDPELIKDTYKFEKLDNGLVKITVNESNASENYPDLKIFININDRPITVDFDEYQKVLVVNNSKQNLTIKTLILSPLKVTMVYKA